MCDLFLTASSQQLSSSSASLLWVHFKHDCTHFWPSSFCASFFLYSCYCLIRINRKKMLEKVSLENSSAKLRRTLLEKEQRNIIRSMQRATSQATEQLSANTSIPFLFFFFQSTLSSFNQPFPSNKWQNYTIPRPQGLRWIFLVLGEGWHLHEQAVLCRVFFPSVLIPWDLWSRKANSSF